MAAPERTPIDEFLRVLEVVGEVAAPPVRAYMAFCESPAGKRLAHAVNNAPLILGALAVAMLTRGEPADAPTCAAFACQSPACGARCAWTV